MAEEKKRKGKFFKDFRAELKKVVWTTPKQLFTGTIAVVTIVIITTIIVFFLDTVFRTINSYGINALRKQVQNENMIVDNTAVEENANTEAGDDTHDHTDDDGHDH